MKVEIRARVSTANGQPGDVLLTEEDILLMVQKKAEEKGIQPSEFCGNKNYFPAIYDIRTTANNF